MLEVAIALGAAIFFGATGDILLSAGMKVNGEVKVNRVSDVPPLVKSAFTNPLVLAGVAAMATYFAAYIAALAFVDVSVANPLTALSYVIAAAYAVFVLRERVGWSRGVGIVLVTVGAILVGFSS